MSSVQAVQSATIRPAQINSNTLLLQRKCTCGGSAGLAGQCTECQNDRLLGKRLQTKLSINEPGDEYEQEADRVADQVIRMPDATMKPEALPSHAAPLVQRRVAGSSSSGIGAAPAIVHDVLSSPGQPLDAASRAFFEPRFGHDLSQVLIHTDPQAAGSARAVDARAYTVGQHIAFDAGQYAPTTSEGKRLLAHELTHTMQQHNHRSLGIGTVSSLLINRQVEHYKHGAERTFTATTHIRESQQPSTYHVTHVRLDHPLAVQRVCKGSTKTGNAIVSAREDDYKKAVKAGTYCRDSGFTGALHSGTCYREVPTRSSYSNCPPGDQVCFDNKGGCKDSPDKVSPVQKQERDGSCNLHWICAALHGVREVEPVQGAILGKFLGPPGVGTVIGALIGLLKGRE